MKVWYVIVQEAPLTLAFAAVLFAALQTFLACIPLERRLIRVIIISLSVILVIFAFIVIIGFVAMRIDETDTEFVVETHSQISTMDTGSDIKEETPDETRAEQRGRPYIQFNSVEFIFQIDDNIEVPAELNLCPIYRADEYGNADYHFNLSLDARNIGTETAKDIKITISEESSINAIEEFNDRSVYCDMEYQMGIHGYWMKYSDETYADLLWFEDKFEDQYILPGAEDVRSYKLPDVYYCLVNAMRIENKNVYYDPFSETIMIPDIEIELEYSDVQGIQYKEKAYIHTEGGWVFSGGRSLVVSIIPQEK